MSLKLLIVIQMALVAAYARTPAEIRRWMMFEAFDCAQAHPMDAAEIKSMLDHKPASSPNAKCFIACVFKKLNWINENGEFDLDKGFAFIEEEFAGNATSKEISKKVFDTCKLVNDEPVSDGNSGCERASNLAKCLIENSAKVGINLEN